MTKPDRPELQWLDPNTLDVDPGNPRTIDPDHADRLRAGLARFGFVENLVLNGRTGELISGHQRRAQAIELGVEAVPVMVLDLPEEEARALGLLLNNDDAQGEWAPELLAIRLEELKSAGTLDLAAFDTSTLARFGVVDEPDAETVTFEASKRDPVPGPVPDEPETQPGDVWQLGGHLVVCADAFELDVVALNDGQPVTVVVTDPPFAIFGSSTGVASDVTDDRMVRPFFAALSRRIALALPHHGHAYIHCDWRSWAALWEGSRAGGLAIRNMLVWTKAGGLGSNYGNSHELIAFAHHMPKASNTFDNRRDSAYRPVYALNVLHHNRPHGDERHHNAAKPVALIEDLIANSTGAGPEGAVRSGEPVEDPVVLDLFAGSGSTLIAAENLGARCIAVEIEPGWCDVIVERWRTLTGKRGRRLKGRALDHLAPPAE